MLLQSEIFRTKDELGFNQLLIGAEPYVGTSQLFEQVIQVYTAPTPNSTSTTLIVQQLGPTITQVTLADATGFNVGDNVAVDTDARYEQARIEQISGNNLILQLTDAHGDATYTSQYMVAVEGGEMIIREKLRMIALVKIQIKNQMKRSGVQKVDEVTWFPGKSGTGGGWDGLLAQLKFWRDELAHSLGVTNLRDIDGSSFGGGSGLDTGVVLY